MRGVATRRRLVFVVAALCLGVLSTVVVAFGCAWRERDVSVDAREATRYPDPPDCGMKVKRLDSAMGFDILVQTGMIVESVASPNSGPGDVERIVPEWARPALVPWGWHGGWQIGQWSYRRVSARGWPMAAMSSTMKARAATHSGFGSWAVVDGIALDAPTPPGVFSATTPRALPTHPIVAGFVVDSAVYAVPWMAIFLALGAAHRAFLRRRNRCVACGYDRRATAPGDPCPECGAIA